MEKYGFICVEERREFSNGRWTVKQSITPWTYEKYISFFNPGWARFMRDLGGKESKRTVYKEYGGATWPATYVRSTSPDGRTVIKRTLFTADLFHSRTPRLFRRIIKSGIHDNCPVAVMIEREFNR